MSCAARFGVCQKCHTNMPFWAVSTHSENSIGNKCVPDYSMSTVDGLCFLDVEPCVARDGPCPICQFDNYMYKDEVVKARLTNFGRMAHAGDIIIRDDDSTSTSSEVVPFIVQRLDEARNLFEPMKLWSAICNRKFEDEELASGLAAASGSASGVRSLAAVEPSSSSTVYVPTFAG